MQPACVTHVQDDMVVVTDSEKVESSVKSNLRLLRAHHPNLCMTCEASGKCEVLRFFCYLFNVFLVSRFNL
jgi:NADH-quinone oxidoreductase subunit G